MRNPVTAIPPSSLTPDEQRVMDLLVEAHNAFVALPVQHPMHAGEWTRSMHELQRLILSRPTSRTMGLIKE